MIRKHYRKKKVEIEKLPFDFEKALMEIMGNSSVRFYVNKLKGLIYPKYVIKVIERKQLIYLGRFTLS